MLGGLLSLLIVVWAFLFLIGWMYVSFAVWLFIFVRLRKILPEAFAFFATILIFSFGFGWGFMGLIGFVRGSDTLSGFAILTILTATAAAGVWSIKSGAWGR